MRAGQSVDLTAAVADRLGLSSRSRPGSERLLAFFAAYILAAGFGQLLAIVPDSGITLWPPSGVFLATLVSTRRQTWPWWILAGLAAELTCNVFWFGNPVPLAMLFYSGNALEALLGAMLLSRFSPRPAQLETLGEVIVLVVIGALIAPCVSATIGSAGLHFAGKQSFTAAWPSWWIGDATGMLLLAPLSLVILQNWRETARISRARIFEAAALIVIVIGVGALSLSGIIPFAFIVMPPLLWAAVRFEFEGAAVTLLVLALLAAVFTVTGLSQFAGDAQSIKQKQMMVQLFLAVSSLSALVVAALSRQHHKALETLATANKELERRVAERTANLEESEQRLQAALRAGSLGVHELDVRTGRFKWDAAVYRLWGLPEGEPVTLDVFEKGIHAEDLRAVRDAMARALDPKGERRYSAQFRVVSRLDHAVRWVLAEGEMSFFAGKPERLVGTVQDITERKRSEEQLKFLTQEVNHRSKNLLALVQAVARQTAASSPADFTRRFGERIQGLAASQDLLVKSQWCNVPLEELVRSQLAHFRDLLDERIVIAGPKLDVTAAAAQTIGLAVHELSTNAGKYGALSNAGGRVRIGWLIEEPADGGGAAFTMEWSESGGPPVEPPKQQGFGATVVSQMTKMSLDADVRLDYGADGVTWRLHCPAERVIERYRHVPQSSPNDRDKRVLVVEDEAIIAHEIADVLASAGLGVVGPAATVTQALELIDREGCDAAVLDFNLGRDTAEPIAARLKRSGTPFVSLSGTPRDELPAIFRETPALTKPLEAKTLIATIRRSLADDVPPAQAG